MIERRKKLARYFFGSVLTIVAIAALLPFVWMFFSSFKTEGQLVGHPEQLVPSLWTIWAYSKVIEEIPFFRMVLNSIVFAGGVTFFSLLFDSAAGYALAKLPFPGRSVAFVLVLVTLMIPFQVIMVPLYLLIFNMKLLDTYAGLIIPRMTNAFGIYFMRQFFLTVPNELLDAGRMDGLSEFGIYVRISLSMTRAALATLGIFHFMYNWNDFLWPLLITNTQLKQPLPVGLALFQGEHSQDYTPILAGALLSILPILVIFLFTQRSFMRGIALSGIKG